MSDNPEIKALDNILQAKNEYKNKLTFEKTTLRAKINEIKRLEKELAQNTEEYNKLEENLKQYSRLKTELENVFRSNEVMTRNIKIRKTELESELYNKRARNAEKSAWMDKNLELYQNKYEDVSKKNEASPLAVEKTKTQNKLKLLEFNEMLLKAKLDSLKNSLKMYRAIQKKQKQILMVKFARAATDSFKNQNHMQNLKKEMAALMKEVDSYENNKNTIMMEIENLRRRKTDKLNEQSVINRKKNFAKMSSITLPPLTFTAQDIPMLQFPMSLDEKTQDFPNTNKYFDTNNLYGTKNFNDAPVKDVYDEPTTIFTEKEVEKCCEDGKKPDSSKINIISNVTLNSEETDKILDQYFHKIPHFNKQVKTIVGKNAMEIDTKDEDIEEMEEYNTFPQKDNPNVFVNENANMNEDKASCAENETPEPSKLIPWHQEYVCVAKENFDNVTSPRLCLSQSKFFEKEASPVKVGFAHSTPKDQMHNADFSMVEMQCAVENMNVDDQMHIGSEPTKAEVEVANEEASKLIVSPNNVSTEPGFSGVHKPSQSIEAMLNFLKHGNTQNSDDSFHNFANFLNFSDMGNRCVSPKHDESAMGFDAVKAQSTIEQRFENVSDNASGGFFNIFKKNTAPETAPKDSENKPAFNFNFSAQENKKFSSFPHFFN